MRTFYALWRGKSLAYMVLCTMLSINTAFGNSKKDNVEAIPSSDASSFMMVMCPSDVSAPVGVDSCSATIPIPAPTPDPNCTLLNVSYKVAPEGQPFGMEINSLDASGEYSEGVTIIEWHINYTDCDPDTCIQKITITDGIPPTLTVIENDTTDCSIDDVPPLADYGAYLIAGGMAEDNCMIDQGSFMLDSTKTDGGFNPETVVRYYSIADDSGNRGSFGHTIIVKDRTVPDISCDTATVALSFGNPDMVSYKSFYVTVSDNCGEPVSVSIMRMDDMIAGDSVSIGCDDIGILAVVLEVTDQSGNTNTCMTAAKVSDNIPPIIMLPISDVTISCSYPLDTSDMSELGKFDINTTSPSDIIVDDPELSGGGGLRNLGFNGMIQENCPDGLKIEESIIDNRACGTGTIVRNFVITDSSGNVTLSSQNVTIVDPSPFSLSDITWPRDTIYESCNDFTDDLDVTGRPILNITDVCSNPTATKKDLVFQDPNSGCLIIQRTWKVIDWCNYDKDNNIGVWTDNQYIKVLNSTPPDFIDTADSIHLCAPEAQCDGTFTFENTANDDCTDSLDIVISWELDNDNNGSIDDSGNGRSFTVDLDAGTHKIIWSAADNCGNVQKLEQIVTLKDCKAPTPICFRGLSISLSSAGQAEIWASDFNNHSFDNCTDPEDLILSFVSDSLAPSLTLTCDDEGEKDIQVYVKDECGNQSVCHTYIDVQDNHNVCDTSSTSGGAPMTAMISGRVVTENNFALSEAQINIGGPEMEDYKMTNSEGKYAFEDLETHYNYEIVPIKDDNPLEGVTTLDLVKIQRHILGLAEFDSPYKLIAGDINNDEKVSATDIIQLRKVILGFYDHFPENNSWRFVESKYGIIEMNNPWPFVEGMYVPDLYEDMMDSDFIGVKIGDVDNSMEESLGGRTISTRSDNEVIVKIQDEKILKGQTKVITLTSGQVYDMIALQWTLSFDDEKVKIKDWKAGELKVARDQMSEREGEGLHLSLAWTDLDGINLSSGSELFSIAIEAQENLLLSEVMQLGSIITSAVAYNGSEEKMDISVEWIETPTSEISLYQNTPNPFNDQTYISFELPEDGQAVLTISDISGRSIYSRSDYFNAGKTTLLISADELNVVPGIVYYSLKTNSTVLTKKMILLK